MTGRPTASFPPLEVRVQRRGRELALSVSGELDLATAPALEEALSAAFRDGAAEEVKVLSIDLSDVGFVDASGVRAVCRCAALATQRELRCVLRLGDSRNRRVFELCEVLDRFELR